MKQKAMCALLSAAVLAGLFPAAVSAAETPTQITKWGMDFRIQDQDCEGDGWEWDASSQTLTLEGFQAEVPAGELEEKAAILLPDESTINLKGDENELTTHSYHCNAIYCEGELYVSGRGSLKITTDSFGASAFYIEHGPLVFDERAEVTVDPAGYVIYLSEAKGSNPVISVQDQAKVIFPDDRTDRNITVTHKSSVKPSDNWLDYSEEIDRDEETVTLVKKVQKTDQTEQKEETEDSKGEETTPETDTYTLSIGSSTILKNGEAAYEADTAPYLQNGYTMLPLRALLAVTDPDLDVKWNAATKTAYFFLDNEMVSIRVGTDTYTKAENKIALSTPAETKDGRLFVSLRDWMNILEIADSALTWDSATKTVTLQY